MRMLWREAGIAALVCGALTACASPAYPINDDQRATPRPMARPAYPISESAPPAEASRTMAPRPADAPTADAEPASAPLSAPIAPVDSQPLPAPGPSSSAFDSRRSDGARLQYASLTTQAPTTSAEAPTATAPSSAPVSTALPAAAPAAAQTTSPSPSPAASTDAATTPATTPAVPSPPTAEPALTPQMVVHDQPTSAAPAAAYRPAPVREAAATTIDHSLNAPNSAGLSVAGDVVSASGDIFQNYEVQRGDHIDALARAFSTSREELIKANHIRSPFTIHPGEIMKVPVAKAYVARSGDTLTGVARRFAVGVDELAQLNRISTRAALQPGQEIGLPSSMRDRGPLHEAPAEYATAAPSYRTSPPPPRRYGQIQPAEPTQSPPHATYGYQASQPPNQPSGAVTQVAPSMSDSEIAQAAHGRFVWPIRGDMMARFGPQGVGRRNDGIDIRASQGTAVKAAASGEVVYAGNQVPGFGNLVLIKHPDGWVTAYAHLDQVEVQMKQQVAQGQAVGSVGTSGGAAEPELHFEVRYAPTPADKARPVDPVLVLPLG
jgi:murein DD-endopeptidase MepM/ murein hydrolase activator NlpD